jgi:hypothetical protein
MATEAEILREQGRIAARQDSIESDIKTVQTKIDEILEFVHETRGGNKMLLALLAMASTLGAIVGSIVTYWKGH